jgi:hypothetical protein
VNYWVIGIGAPLPQTLTPEYVANESLMDAGKILLRQGIRKEGFLLIEILDKEN